MNGDDEYTIAQFLLPLIKQTITLKNETLFTISPKELLYAIRAKYISREVVAAAIGADENTADALNHEDDSWSMSRIVERNAMRNKLRRELGLEGDSDEQE